jgi:hypothetical protein
MKRDNTFNWFILLSCISLFGLVTYRLANPNLTDEEKKKISYGELVLSFFASIMVLFFMIYLAMGTYFFLRHGQLHDNPNYLNNSSDNLQLFLWAIFCIITSPLSLTIIQYSFQDKLATNDKYLSIVILISTLYSAMFPLRMMMPSLFKGRSHVFF